MLSVRYLTVNKNVAAVLCSLALSATAVAQQMPDISKPPCRADVSSLIENGWEPSRKLLADVLTGELNGQSLSSPAYLSWLDLQKWFALLSTHESEAVDIYLGELAFSGEITLPPKNSHQGNAARKRAISKMVSETYRFSDAPLAARIPAELALEFLTDADLTHAFFDLLEESDFLPLALENLVSLRTEYPEAWPEYKNLAVALALVFDQKPPSVWPHRQVDPKAVRRDNATVSERLLFWKQSAEDGRLLLDIRKLDARHLVFLVDALVSRDELVWAQKNVRFSRATFDQAFNEIKYDNERLKKKQLDWPWHDYSLETIKRTGGICVDQAYYAAMSAKAKGLPALMFSGQGVDGGHAWFGYMKNDGAWDFKCGRYPSQNYTVGEAINPHNWRWISDHELSFLSENLRSKQEFALSRRHLDMARLFGEKGDTDKERQQIEAALAVFPKNLDAWNAKTEWLEKNRPGEPALMQKHFEEASSVFAAQHDLKTDFQLRLANFLRRRGQDAAAWDLEQKIIGENRSRRVDLSVQLFKNRLEKWMRENDPDSLLREYRNAINQIGKNGGGNFYYDLVRPTVLFFQSCGQIPQAKLCLRIARDTLRPDVGSILDGELKSLEDSVNKPR